MPRSFKLLETLGEGAFGAVHLAEVRDDEDFVQTLAVKWLHPRWSADAHLAGRLRDEARLLALLNHEHIVRVHGLTRLEGRLAILMEPVDGADLARVDGPMPPKAALEAMAAVADALQAAWNTVPPGAQEPLRVVHRDIKPSNVMVTARGLVKVMDFGVARARFDTREAHTQSQQFGTARYMAPERWLEGVAEAPSDVFSLGITLLELIAGAPIERPRLSPGAFSNDIAVALKSCDDWPEVRGLVQIMVAYEPDQRPTSAKVAIECRDIASRIGGPGLREWAEEWVEDHRVSRTADGVVVPEDSSGAETFQLLPSVQESTLDTARTGTSGSLTVPIGTGIGGLVVGVVLTLVVIVVPLLVWLIPGPAERAALEAATAAEAAEAAEAEAAGSDEGSAPDDGGVPDAGAVADQGDGTDSGADADAGEAPEGDADEDAEASDSTRTKGATAEGGAETPAAPPATPGPEPAAAASSGTGTGSGTQTGAESDASDGSNAEEETAATTTLILVADSSLTMQLADVGAIRSRTGTVVPEGYHSLTVDGSGEPFQCTLDVKGAVTRYSVDGVGRTCERQ